MGNEEKARLGTLIDYWMEHNREHSQEFREWAERAGKFGPAGVGGEILKAAQELDKATEHLSRARRQLEG